MGKVMIDYLPDGEAQALKIEQAIASHVETTLSLRDVALTGRLNELEAIVSETDIFIVVWSESAQLFGNSTAYSRERAKQLFDVGPDNFLIFNPDDRPLPLVLSDLKTVKTISEIDHQISLLLLASEQSETSFSSAPQLEGQYFLSYSSLDSDCADTLENNISKRAVVWRDRSGMTGPTIYGTQILRAIDTSEGLVLLLTRNSQKSPHCIREVYAAVEGGKNIIAFSEIHPEDLLEDWRYPLMTVQLYQIDCNNVSEQVIVNAMRD